MEKEKLDSLDDGDPLKPDTREITIGEPVQKQSQPPDNFVSVAFEHQQLAQGGGDQCTVESGSGVGSLLGSASVPPNPSNLSPKTLSMI